MIAETTRCRILGAAPLRGELTLPADPEIVENAALLAALADGTCTLHGVETLEPRLAGALERLGVTAALADETLRIEGVGLDGLRMPREPIDCGERRPLLYRLAGLLAGQRFGAQLAASGRLAAEPLDALVGPLRARGAWIAATGAGDALVAPLRIAPQAGAEQLQGLRCELPEADADLKAALLLSGLRSPGLTALWEPTLTSDVLERMLLDRGMPLFSAGTMLGLEPSDRRRLPPWTWTCPGATATAAALSVAALVTPGSQIALRDVAFNPSRTGLFDALKLMGARWQATTKGDAATEPMADLHVRTAALRSLGWSDELWARTGQERPAAVTLAALARGTSELPPPSSGGAATPAADWLRLLQRFGLSGQVHETGTLRIEGLGDARALRPVGFGALHDPDLALAAVLLALAAPGESELQLGRACLLRHGPLLSLLVRLGARLDVG